MLGAPVEPFWDTLVLRYFLSISFCPFPLVLLLGTTEQSLALQMMHRMFHLDTGKNFFTMQVT